MTVVDVIQVVTVLDCVVAAAGAVFVGVPGGFGVALRFAFVVVAVVFAVKVPVVRVVHVVTVLNCVVAAAWAVGVVVLSVLEMCRCHRTLLFQRLVS
ncbi:hypothetical protein KHQ06_24130 [Nocardia tengchongensis]|uniref:Uncharacterized protein n=1 Tax=Nocardia tengchongensis TaxID=2055889 RepID=A0ABX8CLS7_9NOCA|nr:hypothetical protein KHQ06_24130 [Nocardia tengchongensis]